MSRWRFNEPSYGDSNCAGRARTALAFMSELSASSPLMVSATRVECWRSLGQWRRAQLQDDHRAAAVHAHEGRLLDANLFATPG